MMLEQHFKNFGDVGRGWGSVEDKGRRACEEASMWSQCLPHLCLGCIQVFFFYFETESLSVTQVEVQRHPSSLKHPSLGFKAILLPQFPQVAGITGT